MGRLPPCSTSTSSMTRPPPPSPWTPSGAGCSPSWPGRPRPPPSPHGWGSRARSSTTTCAPSYVVSPRALGPAASDPDRETDRLSAGYLIALAARVVREVGDLLRRSRAAGRPLASLAIDAEIRFRSPAERAAFTDELTRAV